MFSIKFGSGLEYIMWTKETKMKITIGTAMTIKKRAPKMKRLISHRIFEMTVVIVAWINILRNRIKVKSLSKNVIEMLLLVPN